MQQEKEKTIVESEEVYIRNANVKSNEDEDLKNSSNVVGGANSGKKNQGSSRKICEVSCKPDTSKTEESMQNINKRKEELKWGMVKHRNVNRGESSGETSPRKRDTKSNRGCKSRDQTGTFCRTPTSGLSVSSVQAVLDEFTGVAGDIASMSKEIHEKFLESKNKKITAKDINALESAVDVCNTFTSLLARLEENVGMARMGLKDYVNDWCQIVKEDSNIKKNKEEGTEEKISEALEASKNSEEDKNTQSDKDNKRKMQKEKEKKIVESEVVYKKKVDDKTSEEKELQASSNVDGGPHSGKEKKGSSREICKRYHNPDTSKTEELVPTKKKQKGEMKAEKMKQKYVDGEKNSEGNSLMERDNRSDWGCEPNDQIATSSSRILPSGLNVVSIHLIMKKFRSVVVDTVAMSKEILEKILECENKMINVKNIDSIESAVDVCKKFSSLFASLEVNVGIVREGLEQYVKEWCEIVKKDIRIKQEKRQENKERSTNISNRSCNPDTSEMEESILSKMMQRVDLKREEIKQRSIIEDSSGGKSLSKSDSKSLKNDLGCEFNNQTASCSRILLSGITESSIQAVLNKFRSVIADTVGMSKEIQEKLLECENKEITAKNINCLESAVDLSTKFSSLLAGLECNVRKIRNELEEYVKEWCQTVKKDKIQKNNGDGTEEKVPKALEASKNSEEDKNTQSDKDNKRKMQKEKEKKIVESEVVYKKKVDDKTSEEKELQASSNVDGGPHSGKEKKGSSREICKRYHNPDTSKTEELVPTKKKQKGEMKAEKMKQKYVDGEKNSEGNSLMERDNRSDWGCEPNDQIATSSSRILPSGLNVVSIHLIMKKFRSVVVDTVAMSKEILEKILECENKMINVKNIDSIESAVDVCKKFSSLFASLEVNVGIVREGLEQYVKEWCEIVKKDIRIKQEKRQENKERSTNISNRSCNPDTSEMEESILSKMMQRVDLKREEIKQRSIIEDSSGGKSLSKSDSKSLKNDLGCEFNNQTASCSRILLSGITESSIQAVLNKFRSVIADTVGMSKEIQEKLLECENKEITAKNINCLESAVDLSTKFSSLLAGLECNVRKIRNELEEYVKEWCQTVKKDKIQKNNGDGTEEKVPKALEASKNSEEDKNTQSDKDNKRKMQKEKEKKIVESEVVYKKKVDDKTSEEKELQASSNVDGGPHSGKEKKGSSREICKRYHNPDTSKTEELVPTKKKQKGEMKAEKMKQKYVDGEKNSEGNSLMERDNRSDWGCEPNDQIATSSSRILPSGLNVVSIHLIMKKFRSVVVDTVAMSKEILEKILECENKMINVKNIDSIESAVDVCKKFSSLFASLEVNVGIVREGLEQYVKEWCEIVKKDIRIKQEKRQENKERSTNISNRSCNPDTSEMEESILSKMMQRVDLKREEIKQRSIIEDSSGGKSLSKSDSKSLKNDLGCEFNNQTASCSRILLSGITESSIQAVLNKFRSVIADTVGMSKEIQEKLLECENKEITAKNINCLESAVDLSTKFSSLLAGLECNVRKIRNELEEYVKEWCQTVKKDKIQKNNGDGTEEKVPKGILPHLRERKWTDSRKKWADRKKWTDSRKKEHSKKMKKHWEDKKKKTDDALLKATTNQPSHENVKMTKRVTGSISGTTQENFDKEGDKTSNT